MQGDVNQNLSSKIIMTEDEEEKIISGSPLFEGIPQNKLNEIAKAVQHQIVPSNTIVFRQGDPGDCFYIIYSGKARIFRKAKDGADTELALLGPGDSVGEMALLTGEPRSAYLETLEETHLLLLTKVQFDRILLDYPNITLAFVKQMSKKLLIERKTQGQFQVSRSLWIDYIIILVVSLLFCIIFNRASPRGLDLIPHLKSAEAISFVDTSTAIAKFREGSAIFIDARPNTLFEQGHIQGALNIPLGLFDIMYMMELSSLEKTRDIIVYGRTISRLYDEDVAGKLILRSHKNVMVFKKGLAEW